MQVFQVESKPDHGHYKATVVAASRIQAIALFIKQYGLKDDRAVRLATPISFGQVLIDTETESEAVRHVQQQKI